MARPFRQGLGLELVVADQIDTADFGTFTGEGPRPADAATTCRLKAEAALDVTGASLGLAREGSFGPHPAIPFLPLAIEWMTFVDRRLDLAISERLEGPPSNFSHSVIAAGADPGSWLERIGFPAHGVIVRPHRGDPHPSAPGVIVRGLQCPQALEQAIRNPTRMASLRRLAFRLVRRIRTHPPSAPDQEAHLQRRVRFLGTRGDHRKEGITLAPHPPEGTRMAGGFRQQLWLGPALGDQHPGHAG